MRKDYRLPDETLETIKRDAKYLTEDANALHTKLDDLWEYVREHVPTDIASPILTRIDNLMFYGDVRSSSFMRKVEDFTENLCDINETNELLYRENQALLEATEHLGEYIILKEKVKRAMAILGD